MLGLVCGLGLGFGFKKGFKKGSGELRGVKGVREAILLGRGGTEGD